MLPSLTRLEHFRDSLINLRLQLAPFNPFAPEPPVTARLDPGPFYPL